MAAKKKKKKLKKFLKKEVTFKRSIGMLIIDSLGVALSVSILMAGFIYLCLTKYNESIMIILDGVKNNMGNISAMNLALPIFALSFITIGLLRIGAVIIYGSMQK